MATLVDPPDDDDEFVAELDPCRLAVEASVASAGAARSVEPGPSSGSDAGVGGHLGSQVRLVLVLEVVVSRIYLSSPTHRLNPIHYFAAYSPHFTRPFRALPSRTLPRTRPSHWLPRTRPRMLAQHRRRCIRPSQASPAVRADSLSTIELALTRTLSPYFNPSS